MRITPELFRRNCSSCAHRALIVHFELAFVLCSCSAWAHHSPSPHQIPSAFTDTAQCSLSFHSAFPPHSITVHSPFPHHSSGKKECFRDCTYHMYFIYYWMNVLFPGLVVCGIFLENQSLQADDIVKKVSKFPLQNQVKNFMIIHISVSRILIKFILNTVLFWLKAVLLYCICT